MDLQQLEELEEQLFLIQTIVNQIALQLIQATNLVVVNELAPTQFRERREEIAQCLTEMKAATSKQQLEVILQRANKI